MKRFFFCIPLLGIAPLGYFLGSYLSGVGTISWYAGWVIASVSYLLLPLLIPILFVSLLHKTTWNRRIILFVVVFLVQVNVFICVPSRVTAELMGMAHRLRNEFSPDELRGCTDQLRAKFLAGNLKLGNSADGLDYFPILSTNTVVDNIELPASLRGRFQQTFILKYPSINNDLVVFALNHETGIICGKLTPMPDWAYPIADDVQVYQDHP